MTVKLNTEKPFGTLCGITEDGAKFTQGGVRFNGSGDPISPLKETPDPAVTPAPKQAVPDLVPTAYKDMPADEVKSLIVERGGMYVNKAEAVAWLTEQDSKE